MVARTVIPVDRLCILCHRWRLFAAARHRVGAAIPERRGLFAKGSAEGAQGSDSRLWTRRGTQEGEGMGGEEHLSHEGVGRLDRRRWAAGG